MLANQLFNQLSNARLYDVIYELSDLVANVARDEEIIQHYRADITRSHLYEALEETSDPFTNWNKRSTTWQNMLLTELVKAYDCHGFLKTDYAGKIGFYATGTNSNLQIVRQQYNYLTNVINALSIRKAPAYLKRGAAKGWYNNFYLEALQPIIANLKSAKQKLFREDFQIATAFSKYAIDAREFHNGIIKNVFPNVEYIESKTPPEEERINFSDISMEVFIEALKKLAAE